ncbi:MAG: hypothetical protein IJZ57_10380 [Clostridia bacterium]|nr:hypothetical protein [Clostridia bacterium]
MKKFVAILLVLTLAFSLSISCFAASYGDVDADGEINSSDALLILQASTGLLNLTAQQKVNANVNNDDNVNSADALLVLSRAVGLIDMFPVEESEEPDIDHGFIG